MKSFILTGILAASLVLNVFLSAELVRLREAGATVPSEQADAPASEANDGTYPFMRVVDGDTIVVGAEDGTEYVRLIGINAPEPNDPGGPECYANEATEHLKQLVGTTGTVTLVFDETQGTRDKYNRLLAYVLLPDGTDLNERMLFDGYVHEYTYDAPYARLAAYKAAESNAVAHERGLWAADACKR